MDKTERIALGARIRQARAANGQDIPELAKLTSIPVRTLEMLEAGERCATASQLAGLAAALRVSADALLGREARGGAILISGSADEQRQALRDIAEAIRRG